MPLSKKLIISIISITGVLFAVLLVIQFVWIKKSIEINRKEFANKMDAVYNGIIKSFKHDKNFGLLNPHSETPIDLFMGKKATPLELAIVKKLDSVFKSEDIYLPCNVAARVGPRCYIHAFTIYTPHNIKLDQSTFKMCLCRGGINAPLLDIGFSFPSTNKYLVQDVSWLIVPSFILIMLLIALFIFIILIINRQKSLASLKNDFINHLTHEFNTPLFSIGLTSKMLLRNEEINKNERLTKYIELITTEKNRLQAQVDKMLQLTAIESGSLLMEKQPVDIHKLIEKNMAGFAAAIEEKNGTISFKANAKDHIITGDEVHLFNAISSLLDNAYKYSPQKPDITVATYNTEKNIAISIQDNGIGISENAMKMIFDKFYRENHGDRHDVKGFGLGLSYVKKIVEMHGGTIKVKSQRGEGTTFTITLPLSSN